MTTAMTRDEAYLKLKPIFSDVLGHDDFSLADGTTAEDVEGWDSLTHVSLIFAIEKAFGIALTTREAKRMRNVGELVDLVVQKAGARRG